MASTAHGESDGGTGSEMGCYVCLLACLCVMFFSSFCFSQISRAVTCYLSCIELVPFYQGSIQCS